MRPLVLVTPSRNLATVMVRTDEGPAGGRRVRLINQTDALLGNLEEMVPVHVLGGPFAIESLIPRKWDKEYTVAARSRCLR